MRKPVCLWYSANAGRPVALQKDAPPVNGFPIECPDSLLRSLVRDKIGNLYQLQLGQKQNLRLKAELENAQAVHEKLNQHLCDKIEKLNVLEVPQALSRPRSLQSCLAKVWRA